MFRNDRETDCCQQGQMNSLYRVSRRTEKKPREGLKLTTYCIFGEVFVYRLSTCNGSDILKTDRIDRESLIVHVLETRSSGWFNAFIDPSTGIGTLNLVPAILSILTVGFNAAYENFNGSKIDVKILPIFTLDLLEFTEVHFPIPILWNGWLDTFAVEFNFTAPQCVRFGIGTYLYPI